MISKTEKPLARLIKKKRAHISKISNEKREATINTTKAQRIRLLWTTICQQNGQLEEMDRVLEMYSLPRPNPEETENIKNLPVTKLN